MRPEHRYGSTVASGSADDPAPEDAAAALDGVLREIRLELAVAMLTRFEDSSLSDYGVGYIDGLMDALDHLPAARSPASELQRAAVLAHRRLLRRGESCTCGMTPACGASESGMFMQVVSRLEEIGRDDLERCRETIERARRRQQYAEGSYDREILQTRVLRVLIEARHELPAKDIAQRIGDGVTGQQVGGALKALDRRGLVEANEYRHPRTGFTVLQWQALNLEQYPR